MTAARRTYPKDWITRRLHSLMGIWLVVYLIEHLLTNSEAALFFGEDGSGFIRMVNAINNLPYLPVIELVLLGLPFTIHIIWGIRYIFTAKSNAMGTTTDKPRLRRYAGNHAFSWQRWVAWILFVGVILHVLQMRFLERPAEVIVGANQRIYVARVSLDKGLYTVADRLGVILMDERGVQEQLLAYQSDLTEQAGRDAIIRVPDTSPGVYNPALANRLDELQALATEQRMVELLEAKRLKKGQVLAISNEFGKAVLLVVRSTFKDPWMLALYTIFVLAAVYHAFRGLWSFAIVWGFTVTRRSQRWLSNLSVGLMVVLGFLGLAAVWLTYWVNLRY